MKPESIETPPRVWKTKWVMLTVPGAATVPPDKLKPLLDLQRKAQWRLDFVNAANSMGFHAPEETARILGESIDYSRQAEVLANWLRLPPAPAPEPKE